MKDIMFQLAYTNSKGGWESLFWEEYTQFGVTCWELTGLGVQVLDLWLSGHKDYIGGVDYTQEELSPTLVDHITGIVAGNIWGRHGWVNRENPEEIIIPNHGIAGWPNLWRNGKKDDLVIFENGTRITFGTFTGWIIRYRAAVLRHLKNNTERNLKRLERFEQVLVRQ